MCIAGELCTAILARAQIVYTGSLEWIKRPPPARPIADYCAFHTSTLVFSLFLGLHVLP